MFDLTITTSHKPQATSHKPQATSHKPQNSIVAKVPVLGTLFNHLAIIKSHRFNDMIVHIPKSIRVIIDNVSKGSDKTTKEALIYSVRGELV
jgi:hypothetical protein